MNEYIDVRYSFNMHLIELLAGSRTDYLFWLSFDRAAFKFSVRKSLTSVSVQLYRWTVQIFKVTKQQRSSRWKSCCWRWNQLPPDAGILKLDIT